MSPKLVFLASCEVHIVYMLPIKCNCRWESLSVLQGKVGISGEGQLCSLVWKQQKETPRL